VVSEQQTAAAKDANEPVSSGNANAPAAKLATPTVSVIVPKTPAVTPQSSQISTASTATTREADLAGETLQPALPPVREIPPEVRQEPKPKDKTVGANTPQPASTGSLTNVTTLIPALPTSGNTESNIITPLPSAGGQGGAQTPKVAVSIPGSTVQPLAPESQSEASVNPVLPSGAVNEAAVVTPEAGVDLSGGETFRYPTLEGYRLNYCFDDARASCGAKAAHSWCEEKGFEKALGWREEKSIGGLFPTIVMGTDQICDRFLCDGFEEITCGS
jgi:hypothetical protein